MARERLFARLDAQRRCAAIWVIGPPGSGKTVLAASYCDARALPTLWYRLEHDDNDAAQFFSSLIAAAARIDAVFQAPVFAPEHLQNLPAYARRFFRALFTSMPRPALLVFDNADQSPLAALPALLAAAVSEAPEGISIIVTCRHRPPEEFGEFVLSGALAVIEESELRFTVDETRQYAYQLGLDQSLVAAAAQQTQGWAAGLRLLGHAHQVPGERGAKSMFIYFENLVRDRFDPECQRLLLTAALLPWVPADLAGTVAEVADAQPCLEHLRQQNLFIERVDHDDAVYRFHPMFREFLREKTHRTFTAAELGTIRRRAARAFAERGDSVAAIDLTLDAGDYAAAGRLLLDSFEARLQATQLDQLAAWLQRFPDDALEQEPRLLYGWARMCFLREDRTALAMYERAHAAFIACGDVLWQQLCAAGILEWSYNSDSFLGHQRWRDVMQLPLPSPSAPVPESHTLRLINGRLLACFFDGDFAAGAKETIDDVLAQLTPGAAENEKLSLAVTLLGCLERHKRWDQAGLLVGKMAPLLDSPSIGPRLKILARQQIAVDWHRQTGNYAEASALARTVRMQAHEHGFPILEYEAIAILLLCAGYTDARDEARRLLDDLAAASDSASIYHQRFRHQMQAWFALQRGDLRAAREHAEALRAAIDRSDMPARFRATWLLIANLVLFADGQIDTALAELEGLCRDAEPGSCETLQVNLLCLRASQELRAQQDVAAAQSLTQAFDLAERLRYYQVLGPLRQLLSELAAFALERGIRSAFVRELICRRHLAPHSVASVSWPWPLRILTLGRFALEIDGAPVMFDGKVPKKPLALLKALVAQGGRAVPVHRLTDALWPDEAGDAAREAFNVALHRLRKLLRHPDAVRLQDDRVSLDAAICWVDAWAFERLVMEADAAAAAGGRPVGPMKRSLAFYAGHFLAADGDAPWAISARERLRDKFIRLTVALGAALIAVGDWEAALACYRNGIEADDLAEEFYLGVMRCALHLGRTAEGLAAYQRLRRMLSLLLGATPSRETEEAYKKLLG